jgi:spermidine synthase
MLPLLACLTLLLAGVSDDAVRIVHVGEGLFGPIFVTDEDGLRSLRFGRADADEQSVVDLRAPRAVPLAYVRTAALGLALVTARVDDEHGRAPGARVLIVGLGGGAFLAATDAYPSLHVDAVEIDPVVTDIARRFFALETHHLARTVIDDGRAFLTAGERRGRAPYDLIFVDAYAGDDYPSHLADDAFFTLVRDRLSPAGVLVLNIALDRIAARALVARVATAFPEGCTVAAVDDDENLVVIASRAALAPDDLRDAAAREDARARHPFALVSQAEPAIACVERLRGRQ